MISKFKMSLLAVLVVTLSVVPALETIALGTVSEPVQTLDASAVTDSSATLNGMLSMEGADERGFEYGFTTSYGQSVLSGGDSDYSEWFTIGGAYGDSPTQFLNPAGLAVDSDGNLYVPDAGASRIKKYRPNGDPLLQWGTEGTGEEQLWGPRDISIGPDNMVYVVDYVNGRIQKYDSEGNHIINWGSSGTSDGQFQPWWPIDIHVTSQYVFVSDYRRVQRFDLDGNFQLSWQSYNGVNWIYPSDIVVDSDGIVYIAQGAGSYNVMKFDQSGGYLGQIAGANGGKIDIDELGNLYLTQNYSISKYNSSGDLLQTWGSVDDPQRFNPAGIAYSSGYGLYFTDGEGIEGTTRVIAINNRPSAELTGLACGSEYSYRAYARYGIQTYYGQNKTFVTEQGSDCEEPVNPPDPEAPGGGGGLIGGVPGVPRTGKFFGFVMVFVAIGSLIALAFKEFRDTGQRSKKADK